MFTSLFALDENHVMLVKLMALYKGEQGNTPTLKVTRVNKAQFMNLCHHVPTTATLQIYSRLTAITLMAISLMYPK